MCRSLAFGHVKGGSPAVSLTDCCQELTAQLGWCFSSWCIVSVLTKLPRIGCLREAHIVSYSCPYFRLFGVRNVLKPIPSDVTPIPLKASVSPWDVTVGFTEAPGPGPGAHVLSDTRSSEDAHDLCPPLLPTSPQKPHISGLLEVNRAGRLLTRIWFWPRTTSLEQAADSYEAGLAPPFYSPPPPPSPTSPFYPLPFPSSLPFSLWSWEGVSGLSKGIQRPVKQNRRFCQKSD